MILVLIILKRYCAFIAEFLLLLFNKYFVLEVMSKETTWNSMTIYILFVRHIWLFTKFYFNTITIILEQSE